MLVEILLLILCFALLIAGAGWLVDGGSALARKYNVKFNQDLYLLGLGTVILFLAMFSGKRKRLDRWEASIMLVIFISYTIYLIRSSIS
ncbi:MAG: hypothetical protein K0B08_00925 [Bacteroidales bacterium]|nr:hypothetical protein [Bacteroidales bacterium]